MLMSKVALRLLMSLTLYVNRVIDKIFSICLNEKSDNPVLILEKMMSLPTCHMHGPEHHIMVGAALLTAYKNAGGEWGMDLV